MRVVLLNTGTELLLGDVQERHLSFIAQQISPLGLRVDEQRTVPDGAAIGVALRALSSLADIIFVTGGLGPTTDDITREMVAEVLGLELRRDEEVLSAIKERLAKRGIRSTARISRQADVPAGAQVLPNENGTAPGFYLRSKINPQVPSPHLFVLPGPPRELQPMFCDSALSILRKIVPASLGSARRIYKFAMTGESIIEEAVGEQILALPGVELGYCARPGEVDLRVIGDDAAIGHADAIIREKLGTGFFSTNDETLEEVIVKLLAERKETLALAESCTGGLLAHRISNVPGASAAFLAGYITYANEAKIDILGVAPRLIEENGAVSEPVAVAMAEGARARAGSTFALATTGIAGPAGGLTGKPAGTVYVALASVDETTARKYFFPNDRETFKQMTSQAAFEMLRLRLQQNAVRASEI